MTPVILAVYFTAFTILGVIALIATGDTRSEKAMLSRARRKRALRKDKQTLSRFQHGKQLTKEDA
jgi:hypothetical protein